MADKPIVFISHITEEADLARILKKHLEKAFLGMVDIFVSSDGESIRAGDQWLEKIDDALQTARLTLILCSEASIKRPWINFEAGASWIKKIPIIPICHTNLRPSGLPPPLNMLQAVEANQKSGLNQVVKRIAKEIGCDIPFIDLDAIVKEIAELKFLESEEVKDIVVYLDPIKSQFYRRYQSHETEKPDDILLQFYCRFDNGFDRKIAFTKYSVEIDSLNREKLGTFKVKPEYIKGTIQNIITDSFVHGTTNVGPETTLCDTNRILYLDAHEPRDGFLVFPVKYHAPDDLCVIQCTLSLETDSGICTQKSVQLLRYDWRNNWLDVIKAAFSQSNTAGYIKIDDWEIYCWIGTRWEIQGIGDSGNTCHLVVVYRESNQPLQVMVSEKSGAVLFDGAKRWIEQIPSGDGFYVFEKRVAINPSMLRDARVSLVVTLSYLSTKIADMSFDVPWSNDVP